jgi:hypothetical protein
MRLDIVPGDGTAIDESSHRSLLRSAIHLASSYNYVSGGLAVSLSAAEQTHIESRRRVNDSKFAASRAAKAAAASGRRDRASSPP